MRFGRWYALDEAEDSAPAEPGVFQIRLASGLIEYPTGKSAMIHYAAADDLRAATVAFAAEHAGRDWLCRHSLDVTGDPRPVYDRLVQRFAAQFGGPPRLP